MKKFNSYVPKRANAYVTVTCCCCQATMHIPEDDLPKYTLSRTNYKGKKIKQIFCPHCIKIYHIETDYAKSLAQESALNTFCFEVLL